jgi:hypothetical protein
MMIPRLRIFCVVCGRKILHPKVQSKTCGRESCIKKYNSNWRKDWKVKRKRLEKDTKSINISLLSIVL